VSSVGRALRHRNFRFYFFGQGISLIGTWLTRVTMSWLVYRLTGSEMLLGLVGFAGQIPTFLLAFVSLTAMPYTVLMPVIAAEVLHGGPHTLGILMAATVVAALLFVRKLPEMRRQVRPIYEQLGILPDIAEGLGRSTNLTVSPER